MTAGEDLQPSEPSVMCWSGMFLFCRASASDCIACMCACTLQLVQEAEVASKSTCQ